MEARWNSVGGIAPSFDDTLSNAATTLVGGWLHELDCCPIRVVNVDNTLASVRTALERLRFSGRIPAGRRDCVDHRVQIIDYQRDVDVSDIA